MPGNVVAVSRRIVGFFADEEHHWVARLECGHNQHVRHTPPWMNRPWVMTPEGRVNAVGQVLPCRKCAVGVPPDPKPGAAA